MKQAKICQLLHNSRNAAGLVQIFHIGRTCRCQMTEIRCFLTDLIGKGNIKVKTNLMGNSRQMQHGIGRASKCHIYGQCI